MGEKIYTDREVRINAIPGNVMKDLDFVSKNLNMSYTALLKPYVVSAIKKLKEEFKNRTTED